MGQHAKRFDSVGAQRGSGLRAIVDQLKSVADTAEEWFDGNSPAVVSAMQRFEQGLALLKGAPAHPESADADREQEETGSGDDGATGSGTRKSATRRKPEKKPDDDGGEG